MLKAFRREREWISCARFFGESGASGGRQWLRDIKPVTFRFPVLLGIAGIVLSYAAGVHAQSAIAAGKAKAQACIACHGALGLSQLPNAPHLAGQPEIYFAEQLKAYRSGKRSNEVMTVIAKPLTDEDIGQLAAWYASLVIEVKPP